MSELCERMRQLVDQMDEDLKKFPYAGDNSSEEGYLLWTARNALAPLVIEAKFESIIDSAVIDCLTHLQERVGPNLNYASATKVLGAVIAGLKERKQNER